MSSSSSLQTTFEGMVGIQPKKPAKLLLGVYAPCINYEELKTTKKTDVGSAWNFRRCLGVFMVSMLVNVCLLGSLAWMQLSENSAAHTDDFPASDVSGSICLSCDSFNVPNPESDTLAEEVKVINIGEHTTLCCLRRSEHLRTILKLVAGEYVDNNERTGNVSAVAMKSSHPSAHLYLDTTSEVDSRMQWESDAGYGTAHVTGGVAYNNGSLRVSKGGVYFLYSHLTLSDSPGKHIDGGEVLHCVQRYNQKLKETGNQLLLMSKLSMNDGDKKTTFLAANLRLRRNDEVFVQFSDPSLIYKYSPSNFFGLYRL